MPEFSVDDQQLMYHLSGDLGESPAPYADLAERLGLSEDQVLDAVRRFQAQGLIRRLGATLWHQRSGLAANALLVFKINDARIVQCGEDLAALPYVSHCYARRTVPGWPFNLYAMVHAESRDRLLVMVGEMVAATRAEDWRMLESLRELKKDSRRYFAETAADGE